MSSGLRTVLMRCVAPLVGMCVLAVPLLSSATVSAFADDETETSTNMVTADVRTDDSAAVVTSWKWDDDGQLTQRDDGGWELDLPGVDENNPLTKDALSELLPDRIVATMDGGETMPLDIDWDLSTIGGGVSQGEYVLTASLADAGYALSDDVSALAVTVRLGDAESYTALPSGDPLYPDYITSGVSPNGTTIDLFDYWLTGQTDSDANDPWDGRQNKTYTSGINNEHALLFTASDSSRVGDWNQWTRNDSPHSGIVASELGEDGYPVLNDLDTRGLTGISGRDGKESLAYLFDPNNEQEGTGRKSYPDVQGLLQVDSEGYYSYDSTQNYAVYYPASNSFTLYEYPGVTPGGASGRTGQFFPFNEATSDPEAGGQWSSSLMNNVSSIDGSLNHYFGVHMSTRFIQQNEGYRDNGQTQPVTYEFSGDDDVWIFIDGKLVADLGGIHDAASVNINFVTGDIVINGDIRNPRKLGRVLGLNRDTLIDNTYHTLDFFYLERGNVDSNMNLKYNLVTIPESDLIKVDQIGNPVPGAVFELCKASEYGSGTVEPIATGTTDAKGSFVFVDSNDMPLRIQDLYQTYKGQEDNQGNNLILVEKSVPNGYRSSGPIGLYFYDDTAEGDVLLLSNSIWDKGAYAMPKVTATAGNTIYFESGHQSVDLSDSAIEDPVMFAVVFQKQDDGNWLPISGDPISGWTLGKDASWDSVLTAAKAKTYQFQLGTDGAYQVEVSNLPGDIKDYYYIEPDKTKDKAQYTVRYYYTEADSIAGASENNTWQIATEGRNGRESFDRVFSMNLYVSNIKNYLLVQKVDDTGSALNGADFSLYKADDVEIVNGNLVPHEGATAYDSLTTADISNAEGTNLALDGGGVFPATEEVLPNGEYYLVETQVPPREEGSKFEYELNSTPTHIVVDNTGVYADAGTDDDGVSVTRGVGSIIRSMVQFASADHVDITLNRITAVLATGASYDEITGKDADTVWKNADDDNVLDLKFENGSQRLDYGAEEGSAPALTTDAGWSKLFIRQKYTGNGSSSLPTNTNLGTRDITNLFSGTVTVRVTNNCVGTLKIGKIVAGNMGDRNKDFTFTIKTDSSICPTNVNECTYSYTGGTVSGVSGGNSAPENGELTFEPADGDSNSYVATFKLKHGQSITVEGLPASMTCNISEPDAIDEGYKVDFAVPPSNASGSEIATYGASPNTVSMDLSKSNSVIFTNTRNLTVATGLQSGSSSWLWAVGIAGFGGTALVITGKLSGAKRRRGRHAQ